MELQKTDPEFMERFRHFAFDEVVKEENQQLDAPTRYLAILAALIGCGGVDAYQEMLPAALENGVTPVMVKETVYQAADYLGYGRMLPFLNATNEIFAQMEIALPLPGQDMHPALLPASLSLLHHQEPALFRLSGKLPASIR